jgi:hemerythrin
MEPSERMAPRSGNRFLDLSHINLQRSVAGISEACALSCPQEQVIPRFEAFLREMNAHFELEELIIRACGYGEWREHAHKHEEIGTQLVRLVEYLRLCDVSTEFMRTIAVTLDALLYRHEIAADGAFAAVVQQASDKEGDDGLIAWDRELETGVESVDLQHRELVDMLNALARMTDGPHTVEAVVTCLDSLRDHALAHFTMEEGVLRGLVPRQLVQHHALHKMLAAQLGYVRGEVAAGRFETRSTVRDFLRFWLLDHVLTADRPVFQQALPQGPVDLELSLESSHRERI